MKSVKSQNVSKYQILPNNCALFAKKFIANTFQKSPNLFTLFLSHNLTCKTVELLRSCER